MSDLSDKTLKCSDCGADFVWTANEQDFYAQKGFENPPKRCPACRKAKKQQFMASRQMYNVTCAKCGKPAQVPFQPRGDRPVYCSECFKEMKMQQKSA